MNHILNLVNKNIWGHSPGGLSVSIVIPVGSTCGGNASYSSGSSSSTADNIADGIPALTDQLHTLAPLLTRYTLHYTRARESLSERPVQSSSTLTQVSSGEPLCTHQGLSVLPRA